LLGIRFLLLQLVVVVVVAVLATLAEVLAAVEEDFGLVILLLM
jgi:hypothetical protein